METNFSKFRPLLASSCCAEIQWSHCSNDTGWLAQHKDRPAVQLHFLWIRLSGSHVQSHLRIREVSKVSVGPDVALSDWTWLLFNELLCIHQHKKRSWPTSLTESGSIWCSEETKRLFRVMRERNCSSLSHTRFPTHAAQEPFIKRWKEERIIKEPAEKERSTRKAN